MVSVINLMKVATKSPPQNRLLFFMDPGSTVVLFGFGYLAQKQRT